jgi:hypothetical protein
VGRITFHTDFSRPNNTLLYKGKPLSDELLNESRRIYQGHLVTENNPRAYYESLLFCIASQGIAYERPIRFIRSMRNDSLDDLADPSHLEGRAMEAGLPWPQRYHTALAYIHRKGIEHYAEQILTNPHETRLELAKANVFIGVKTSSFWHLTLGGTKLLTIDRHVLRDLYMLGVSVDPSYLVSQERKSGATKGVKVPKTLRKKEYIRLEQEALAFFCDEWALLDDDGDVNGGLLTALFWGEGAQRARAKHRHGMGDFVCPYSPEASRYAQAEPLPDWYGKSSTFR